MLQYDSIYRYRTFSGIALLMALMLLVCANSAQGSSPIQGIINLNSENYQQALGEFPYLLVYYSSVNCQHCNEMDVSYAIVEQKFRESHISRKRSPTVVFAKILYEEDPDIFNREGVSEAPTFKLFSKG